MSQLAELKTVYPEYEQLQYEALLRGIDRDTLIKFSTYLIGKDLFSGEKTETQSLIEGWFSNGNKVFGDDMYRRIREYEQSTGKSLTVVYSISCLKVLQYGLELAEQGLVNTKSKEQSEIDLFFAMLALNQNEDYHQTKGKAKIEAMFDERLRPAAIMLNFAFPTQDITNFNLQEYTGCQVVKFLMLFNFLEQTDTGRELIKRFCTYYDIEKWQDYIRMIFPLIMAWTGRENAGSVDIVLDKNKDYALHLNFLKKLALSDYVKIADLDYIKLREKPLIQLDDTNFRVIHPLFIADKIYKGLFFLLKQLNDTEPPLVTNFRSWYTTNFSEGYCFNEIIKYAFNAYSARYFDDELRALDVIGPPDCYLRYEQDVFLLENKDIFIGAGIKGAYDFENLIAEIKKKLLAEGKKPVGIGQIITNIRKLLTKANDFDQGLVVEEASIYPIIVLHDPMFDAPGLNKVMNSLYQEELAKAKADGLAVEKVTPLTLINIDTLIQLAPVLKHGTITLKELLEEYFKLLNGADEVANLTQEQAEELERNAALPFSIFVPNYMQSRFGDNWRSEELMGELFAKSKIDSRR
ncbi:MAG TPA: hypothetical protein VGN20_26790 [Mucilaginibacter sp.]